MNHEWLGVRLSHFTLILILAAALFVISNAYLIVTRGEDTQSSVLSAYTGLVQVYANGGQAPGLVAKLNGAINLTEEAQVRRSEGDLAGAALLDNQADAQITNVLNEIPVAQENAVQASMLRTMTAAALVPVLVAASTTAFYVILRIWRVYEMRRLYEMRIVEETQDY